MTDGADRTAGVVLAYHPTDEIHENIRLLRAQVPRVYVVNNSPDAASRALLARIADERVTNGGRSSHSLRVVNKAG